MALLNPSHFKTLVAIGLKEKRILCAKPPVFLVGFIAKDSKNPAKRQYYVFLVTNKHVFSGDKSYVDLRFNKKDGRSEIFRQELVFPNNESRWKAHRNEKVDLAVLSVNPGILKEHNIDYQFFPEEIFSYYRNFKNIGIEVGDDVYILGFPLGISGDIQNYACAKWGIISRMDKELISKNKAFLIDSSIFPGNSGSPVVLKPTITSLAGTPAVSSAYLLGVVSGYIPYEEGLYTHQTNPPSLVSLSRENSGLSFVVPIDFVKQIFKDWISEKKRLEKAQKQTQQISEKVQSSLEKEKS
ncbi:MAG: serine protease [Actinomycetota bacterium]|nr:serine protease [Actinomycetota bacterium]